MSRFVKRGAGLRVSALLVAVALAVSWSLVSAARSPSTAPSTEADIGPAEQASVPGSTLTPSVVAPAAKPATPHRVRHGSRAKAHRAHHGRARHRRAVREARQRARAHWRHAGGRDVGWPQCPRSTGFGGRHGLGQPMPDAGVRFVVIGLTNGRSFTPNPCLDRHLRWVRTHHVHAAAYAFLTYPTRGQLKRNRHHGPYDGHRFRGALKNAGHAAARYSIRVMRRHGFTTPHVWLDVEPSSSRPWSGRRDWNSSVVRGWISAYRAAGYTVGFYSTLQLWHDILGRRFRPGLPEWRTAGPASARAALGRCQESSFQGGQAVIAQWWTTHRDFDRLCPSSSAAATLRRYFHSW